MAMDSQIDGWVKCISTTGHIRGVAIEATALVQNLADLHRLKGIAAEGLGEAIIGALLMASYCKSGQKVNLNIQGSGYFQQALVDAYPEGFVRGYVVPRDAVLLEDPSMGPWGSGLLSVLRTQEESGKAPYIGTVPLVTGHLAKDISFYWVQSEQVPSAVGLAVKFNKNHVVSARGFLIQALPGADQETIRTIERHVNEIQLFKEMDANSSPIHVLSQIFQSTAFIIVEEKKIEFKCNCSLEKVQRALLLIGEEELRSIQKDENATSIHCDFCAKEYLVDSVGLEALIQEFSKPK